MKTYMPLDGFRWSCDSDSALCDIPQTNVLGQAGERGPFAPIYLLFVSTHSFNITSFLLGFRYYHLDDIEQ